MKIEIKELLKATPRTIAPVESEQDSVTFNAKKVDKKTRGVSLKDRLQDFVTVV